MAPSKRNGGSSGPPRARNSSSNPQSRSRSNRNSQSNSHTHMLGSPFQSSSPLAEQSLAQDIANCSDDDVTEAVVDDDDEPEPELSSSHGMYRRLSGVAYGASRPVFSSQGGEDAGLTPMDRKQSRDAERSLMRDNHVIAPKTRDQEKSQSLMARMYRSLFSTKLPSKDPESDSAVSHPPTETSPLLNGHGNGHDGPGGIPSPGSSEVDDQFEQAVLDGRIMTTWRRETKTIMSYSAPLIVTFFLQYSISVASIFAVGRIGKLELGAVTLANMTMAVSCLAPFQGLATSLDTLCAQAYGSGHKHLVGLQCQRMSAFLLLLAVPVAVMWLFAEPILAAMVPEAESARLAGEYLRVMVFAIPGIILFECGKRFIQAQGLFHATTYILLIASPVNVFLMWLLVWKLEMGYIGAPIAVTITETLLPILLFLYVRFIDGSQCWGGFNKRAFSNWWSMVRLALPGMIMVEAEWLAFEIITLLSSRFGAEYLAAQSVIGTLSTISFQIPFPMSIAASTRIANLIGAGLPEAAKVAARVTFVLASIIGLFNVLVYVVFRYHLAYLFTNDDEVVALVVKVMPLVAVMQIFDGVCAGAHGILRGIGKQSIGGPANLIAYYVVSLPLSLAMAFGLDWKLEGLWGGVTVGLMVAALIEYIYLLRTDWQHAANEAAARNQAG